MVTQKYMGRGQLIDRLAAQVGSREMALEILKKRGHIDEKGNLTAEGRKRDKMTAEERAKDRAAKRLGRSPDSFTYNPRTNTAKLRKR
jgi:hypothetical protein